MKNAQMEISEVSQLISNGSVYKTVAISKGKIKWVFTKVFGEINYVSIRKAYANPFGMTGKDFESFDQAQENYKSADVKSMILMAELSLN